MPNHDLYPVHPRTWLCTESNHSIPRRISLDTTKPTSLPHPRFSLQESSTGVVKWGFFLHAKFSNEGCSSFSELRDSHTGSWMSCPTEEPTLFQLCENSQWEVISSKPQKTGLRKLNIYIFKKVFILQMVLPSKEPSLSVRHKLPTFRGKIFCIGFLSPP